MALFWFVAFVLALACAAFIARPIIFGAAAAPGTSDDETILQQRLDSIERDLESGLIDESAAEEARREAHDSYKESLSRADACEQTASGVSRHGRLAAVLYLGAAPLAAVLIYINIGTPQFLNAQAPPQRVDPIAVRAAMEKELAELEARAAVAPDDFDVWMTLGRAYLIAGRASDAVRALSKAVTINDKIAGAHLAYGEALVMLANGAVTMDAREAFQRTLEIAPDEPAARYYLAKARYQLGATEKAVRAWAGLLNDAPPDAPWFASVAVEMKGAAAEAGIALEAIGLSEETTRRLAAVERGDAETTDLEAMRGPLEEQVATIAAMPEGQQQQMIEGMVAGLAERLAREPDDPDGWRMLARSYAVLDRPADSANAWRELLKRVGGGPEDWRAFAAALLEQRPDGDNSVSSELESALKKLRSFDSADRLALYHLGYAARAKDDNEAALALWSQLRETLAPDAPLAAELDKLIEETEKN